MRRAGSDAAPARIHKAERNRLQSTPPGVTLSKPTKAPMMTESAGAVPMGRLRAMRAQATWKRNRKRSVITALVLRIIVKQDGQDAHRYMLPPGMSQASRRARGECHPTTIKM
jgi:hypothetical protein